jgi:hypothetical protein
MADDEPVHAPEVFNALLPQKSPGMAFAIRSPEGEESCAETHQSVGWPASLVFPLWCFLHAHVAAVKIRFGFRTWEKLISQKNIERLANCPG